VNRDECEYGGGKARYGVSTNRLPVRTQPPTSIGVIFFISSFLLSMFAPLDHSKSGSQVLKIRLAEMPTMSGRVRPIEKFAEAVGKCSVEVCSRGCLLSIVEFATNFDLSGCGIWQVYRCRLSVSPSRHVCERIYAPQRLLFGTWPSRGRCNSLRIYSSADISTRKLQRSWQNNQL
jgi:hypothetical protein